MADETCTCTTLPDGTHYPACPASPYQAGIRSGRRCRDNLERQAKALRDALRRYGEHDGDCAASVVGAAGDTKCTCGYDEAVANGSPPLRPREG